MVLPVVHAGLRLLNAPIWSRQVGEMALLETAMPGGGVKAPDGTHRSASVRALGPLTAAVIPAAHFVSVVSHDALVRKRTSTFPAAGRQALRLDRMAWHPP